jgi:hypothetical protein
MKEAVVASHHAPIRRQIGFFVALVRSSANFNSAAPKRRKRVPPIVLPKVRLELPGLSPFLLGSAVIGFLYDHSLPALIAFSVVAELAAIPFFLVVARKGT